MSSPPHGASYVLRILAAIALAGSCLAVFVALVTNAFACDSGPPCVRKLLANAQLALAIVGLAPVMLFWIAAWRNSRRLAILALIVALSTYLGWAVLNDAAVHGWDNLKVFG